MATTFGGKMRPSCAQVMGVALLFFFLLSAPSMAQVCQGKRYWPELVGMSGQVAPAIIKSQNPYVKEVPIVREGAIVTMDFLCNRVRVWVKPSGIIYTAPAIG